MSEQEKKDEVKLAKIELGKDYTATISLDYKDKDKENVERVLRLKFKVHVPTIKEDLKISIKEEEILGKRTSDIIINLAARMLATLDTVIDEIYYVSDDNVLNKFDGKFLTLVDNIKQIGKFYNEIVIPLYNEYMKFQKSLDDTGFDELKNLLAQTGKN